MDVVVVWMTVKGFCSVRHRGRSDDKLGSLADSGVSLSYLVLLIKSLGSYQPLINPSLITSIPISLIAERLKAFSKHSVHAKSSPELAHDSTQCLSLVQIRDSAINAKPMKLPFFSALSFERRI